MNSGEIADNLHPLSIKKLLIKLIDFFRPMIQKENISLKMDLIQDDPLVLGDKEALEQVFSNLISNAIKYNRSKGTAAIFIKKEEKSVVIEVQDTGIGIAPEHLPFIFDQFYRVNRKEGQKTKGTGLGLSIAKKIVEAHKGTIRAKSKPGKGSTFTVTLPKAEAGKGANPLGQDQTSSE